MNVFEYAAKEEWLFEINASETGYERKTTFYSDLSIAEFVDGEKGVKKTYERVVKNWKNDKVYFTEFVMCLNWKCWEHYEKGNMSLSKLYSELYYQTRDLVFTEWENDKEKISYFLDVTD